MRNIIRKILKEETSLQKKLLSIINKDGFKYAISSVGGKKNFKKIMKDFDYLTKENVENLIQYQLDNIRKDSEDWGLGEMSELEDIESIERIELNHFVNVEKPKAYLNIYVHDNAGDPDNVTSEIQYRIKEEFDIDVVLINFETIDVNPFGFVQY
jgi:hypothetical protein